jgi:tetratricopeptide (TPR) repeat protein
MAALGYLCWLCCLDADIRFLSEQSPAKWIVYPNPPDALLHPVVESSAQFRRKFRLAAVRTNAALQIKAFRNLDIVLNGVALKSPLAPHNWKHSSTLPVTNLVDGDNDLTVTVTASNGPPALWLILQADEFVLISDEHWKVSWAGAVPRSARPAARPQSFNRGDPLAADEQPLQSLRRVWPVLSFIAVIVAALIGCKRWLKEASRTTWLFMAIVVLWTTLFVNNAPILSPARGFDATEHIRYIQYLLEHHRLPSPREGWAMYHPPLYYALCATVLELAGFSTVKEGGLILVRFIGLAIALAQVALVWAGLRTLFPDNERRQTVGLVVAAFLPAQLYLSQYVTNEVLAATLVTACFCVCLRVVRSERKSMISHIALGVCAGAALLTKVTAVLAVPFLFSFIAYAAWKKGAHNRSAALKRVLVSSIACALVCGWYYTWIWKEFGTPLVSNWSAGLGFDWWQDPGFRNAAYYLSFGEVLRAPFFSGFACFADGVYSTLWGDGLYGGVTAGTLRPPWNHELMAAGYLLALLPTVLVVVGATVAVWRSIKEMDVEWLLLLGFIGLSAFAFVVMTLRVPSHAQSKAFYLLSALLPFCALAGLGWDWLAKRAKVTGSVLALLLGVWALNSYGSFWIPRNSAGACVERGRTHSENGTDSDATALFRRAVQLDARSASGRSSLLQQLLKDGRINEATVEAKSALESWPLNATLHQDAARVLFLGGERERAIELCRRAVELAPNDPYGHLLLSGILANAGMLKEAESASREGLRVRPLSAELHILLGRILVSQVDSADVTKDRAIEARMHLRLAGRLGRGNTDILDSAAWILATHPDPRIRDGNEALTLVRQPGKLIDQDNARQLLVLAAACAETGGFEEAVAAAQQAKTLADSAGDSLLSEQCGRMTDLFVARQPFRELPDKF